MSNTTRDNLGPSRTKSAVTRTLGDPQGFLQGFVPIAGSLLAMACTRGILQTFRGMKSVPEFTTITNDFAAATNGATVYCFVNHKTTDIYYATAPVYGDTGGPTNAEDQLLFFITASGGSITAIGLPKWANLEVVHLVGTGLLDASAGVVVGSRTYFGRDKYIIGMETVLTETSTGAGTAPTVDLVRMKQVTGTAVVLGDGLIVDAVTQDKTAWSGTVTHILTTPALVQHGDRIQVKIDTAGTDGTAEFYVLVGGGIMPQ